MYCDEMENKIISYLHNLDIYIMYSNAPDILVDEQIITPSLQIKYPTVNKVFFSFSLRFS